MDEKLLNLSHQNRRTFKRHFLTSVHCEFGLVGISSVLVFAAEQKLKDAFQNMGFVESKKVVAGRFTMQADAKQPAKIHHESEAIGLSFASQTPKREVQVHGDKIVVSDFTYAGFDEFEGRVKSYVGAVIKAIGVGQTNKVGLRKINSIVIEPVNSYQDACSIFNPALFGIVRSGLVAQDALKAGEDVAVLEKNGFACVLRSRLTKTPMPSSYEANLDFDLVNRGLTSLSEALSKVLPALNATHFDLFMWAATDGLIKLMESP